MSHKTVVILIGVSGSGKSTYANKLSSEVGGAVICSADSYMFADGKQFSSDRLSECHNSCFRNFINATRTGVACVIVDNTNTTLLHISAYVAVADAYDYAVVFKVMHLIPHSELTEYLIQCAGRSVHKTSIETVLAQHHRIMNALENWPTHWPRASVVSNCVPPVTA